MKITQVALTNIKSYEERTEVPLIEGVTAILGKNGAGKSTIQEAIGYALFDSLPFAHQDFVREGASSGCVEVTFAQTTPEGSETYRVTRYAGRAKYEVARLAGEEWIQQDIGTKGELVDWLCARFGLADGDELSDLWETCIGVPQTRFLADFAQTAGNRKTTFDALLGIDAYEDSFGGTLKDVPDTIASEQATIREDIRELTGEVRALPERRDTVADLSAEIASLETKIEETEAELQTTEERYDHLTTHKEHIGDIENDLHTAENDIEAAEAALETARTQLGEAQAAQQKVDAAREGHETYLDAKDREEALEEREDARDELRERKRRHDATVQRLEDEVAGLEEDLETHESAVATMADLADATERHDEVDQRIREGEQMQETIDTLETTLEELAEEIAETVGDLMENRDVIRRIEGERADAPDIEKLESRIGDTKAERTALGTEHDRLDEQIERLKNAEADAACPTCGQVLSAEHRQETIAEREGRLAEIEDERAVLTEQIEGLQERLDAANEIEKRVSTLSLRYEQRDDLAEKLQDLKDERETVLEERDTLETEVPDLSELRETREELADAHESYLQAKTRAEDTADAEAELETVTENLDAEREALADIEDELSTYADLDERLADVRQILQETKDDHETFVQYRQRAETVEEKRDNVERLEAELDAARATREEHAETLAAAREEFDPDEYAALDERITELTGDLGGYRKQKRVREGDREDANAEVERLEAKLDERTELVQELQELAADRRFATWVRENVRAAGPKMREVITERIGQRANQLFGTIRGRATETLEWTSDYEIVVSDADVRKSFDILSGGEKMAAALAVRLAILEQLSSIGIAFLDEPTANLDTEKRANLVEQLDRLDSFEQLAVISQNSTFETMTDYAVTVTKDSQTTEVSAD